MATLSVAVLDIVVDEAEVVAELDRGSAWQRPFVLAGDRGIGEEPRSGRIRLPVAAPAPSSPR